MISRIPLDHASTFLPHVSFAADESTRPYRSRFYDFLRKTRAIATLTSFVAAAERFFFHGGKIVSASFRALVKSGSDDACA